MVKIGKCLKGYQTLTMHIDMIGRMRPSYLRFENSRDDQARSGMLVAAGQWGSKRPFKIIYRPLPFLCRVNSMSSQRPFKMFRGMKIHSNIFSIVQNNSTKNFEKNIFPKSYGKFGLFLHSKYKKWSIFLNRSISKVHFGHSFFQKIVIGLKIAHNKLHAILQS